MNSNQQKWYALDVKADAAASEAIEFALNELDALGTEINNLGWKAPTETLTITGYFNEQFANQIVHKQLLEAVQIYGFSAAAVREFHWREVADEDWLAEWKKHWRPTETDRFIIAPSWETVENTAKHVIRIEPSMAFGTGTHETTRLCLRAIERRYEPEMSFLDVGTGTGILAIAAAKLKVESRESWVGSRQKDLPAQDSQPSTTPGSLLGCDTDEDSIKIAIENAQLNETPEIEFYAGSITENTPAFDFVCANLTADVIVPLVPLLIAKTKQILVLSGILKEQETLVSGELNKLQITNYKIETDGEWISILMENGKRKMEN